MCTPTNWMPCTAIVPSLCPPYHSIYVYEERKAPISSNARVVFTTYYQNQRLFLKNASAICVVAWQKNSLNSYLEIVKKKFPLRAHLTCVAQWAKTLKKIPIWMFGWLHEYFAKAKINVFWIVFFTLVFLRGPSTQFFFSKNIDFSLWGKQCIADPKLQFFQHFSSLCHAHSSAHPSNIYPTSTLA